MSAHVVSRHYIRYLVQAALEGQWGDDGLLWVKGSRAQGTAEVKRLSAYDEAHATRIGQILWDENITSVCHRYNEPRDCPELPGPIGEDFIYDHPVIRDKVEPLRVLNAIGHYIYQACEHPGWPDSEAHAIVMALQDKMIRRLTHGLNLDVPHLAPFGGLRLM